MIFFLSLCLKEPNAISIFSIPLWSLSSSPTIVLKRSFHLLENTPWKMNTHLGFIKIRLAKPIVPVSFSYEHILRGNLLNENQISCSPKVFRVFGYESEQSDESIPLGRFTFEINDSTETQFLFDNVRHTISVIQFDIENNHGNSNYTCLHRLKVF